MRVPGSVRRMLGGAVSLWRSRRGAAPQRTEVGPRGRAEKRGLRGCLRRNRDGLLGQRAVVDAITTATGEYSQIGCQLRWIGVDLSHRR